MSYFSCITHFSQFESLSGLKKRIQELFQVVFLPAPACSNSIPASLLCWRYVLKSLCGDNASTDPLRSVQSLAQILDVDDSKSLNYTEVRYSNGPPQLLAATAEPALFRIPEPSTLPLPCIHHIQGDGMRANHLVGAQKDIAHKLVPFLAVCPLFGMYP